MKKDMKKIFIVKDSKEVLADSINVEVEDSAKKVKRLEGYWKLKFKKKRVEEPIEVVEDSMIKLYEIMT